MLFTLLKPFNQLRNNINGSNKPLLPQLSHHSPAQVLKNFTNVRNLHIELPAGDVGTEDGPVEDNGSIPESFYTNGGLKLRVVWTISSLIAASTRHYLLRPIIKDHPTLRNLILTDADGQGTLCMGCEQLKEFREKPLASSATSNRTQVPASNMKLRYASYLELPEGVSLQGATLVSIKPSVEGVGHGSSTSRNGSSSRKEVETFVYGAFDGPSKAAVKALAKRRTYLLEMNGF
ncbi:F-box protein [Acorus calamus]|uniref:F-box protein n=1 Tax=Acorus calamus TaxID=4465 RepID=A0AAV9D120_ACOCL|nr:F-box protein [Acorus calamus]